MLSTSVFLLKLQRKDVIFFGGQAFNNLPGVEHENTESLLISKTMIKDFYVESSERFFTWIVRFLSFVDVVYYIL